MNAYSYMSFPEDPAVKFFGTLADAQLEAKKLEPVFRPNCVIQLVDVPSDKAGLLAALNGEKPTVALRTWSLTSRGGLAEK
jgi:hypothetical protein